MELLRRVGRAVSTVVEVVGRALDVVFGTGLRSRGVKDRERRRREAALEALTRQHESGLISAREFERRKRRL